MNQAFTAALVQALRSRLEKQLGQHPVASKSLQRVVVTADDPLLTLGHRVRAQLYGRNGYRRDYDMGEFKPPICNKALNDAVAKCVAEHAAYISDISQQQRRERQAAQARQSLQTMREGLA